MDENLINKIKNYLKTPFDEELNLLGKPASDQEIIKAEKELNVKFNSDFKQFIKIFGGTSIGVDIYAFNNNEMMSNDTVIDLTKSFRVDYEEDYRSSIVNNSYVFSMDDMGNPIMINDEDKIIIFYHDSDEYEILTDSFSKFVDWMIEGKSIYDFNE
ncbi:SMI1/KNR4 family protein [Tenacibaculum maritimum]|uniref:SMI1/KNR4 family protein n=1 Tax=Tenacibaculum maritimum TaxID=107401 RepID=UPI001E4B4198|nr:SMI1/KNR4 family protein [Tenacibaculum maritimum]MCD9586009.1 SMI1/KNR4 family protein [Tenacibaculum maritimum]MCD9622169.1 SMI1/KNR4 family protein [Tenacibaculum maritimum]MCD9626014.1 SMI1/KNR4 family protein [Tenacibaculum maritimum]MCD9631501.1 SMI1/KNR4 family protein [Tenacibaculum maritimum]MCD9634392.1 SMI1/KNR4 family protein [Tenacibaculum maritimum]